MNNNPPTGAFLLSKLIELYAKQEGVKVVYKIEKKELTK